MADKKNKLDLSINKIVTKNNKNDVKQNNLYKYNIINNHPSRAFFVGKTGSGKTNLMLSLLLDKKFYGDGYFNVIIIFSPTFNDDATYRELEKKFKKYPPKHFHHEVHSEIDIKVIENVIEEQKQAIEELGKKYSKRVLLLFDDCITDSKALKNKIIKDLYYKSRHWNISIWITSQSYMNLPRDYRLQLSNIYLFKPDSSEIERVANEQNNAVCDSKLLEKICKQATKDKYSFLNINKQCEDLEDCYRKNLDQIYVLK